MANGLTINGRRVDDPQDEALLRRLLEAFSNAHNGDNDISAEEAKRLLDRNGDNYAGVGDVEDFFEANITAGQFLKSLGLFSNAGIKIKKEPSLGNNERELLMELAEKDPWAALEYADKYKDQPYAAELIKTAAEKDPLVALAYADSYKDRPYAAKVIKTAAEKEPWAALYYADRYIDQSYAAEVIKTAAEKYPSAALYYADRYKDQPYAAELIKTAAEKYPSAALEYAASYKDQPYAAELIKTAAEKYPWAALEYADKYIDQSYAAEAIKTAAEKYPSAALEYADKYKDQPYAAEVIEKAALMDPASAIQYPYALELPRKSNKFAVKFLLKIHDSSYSEGEKSKIAALLKEIVAGRMTIESAHRISLDDSAYFNALAGSRSHPSYIGNVSIDKVVKDRALRLVEGINRLHEASDAVRFKSVDGAGTPPLYTMMVYAEEEMFTSSFNGLFDRLLTAMQNEGVTGDGLLDRLGHNRFRVFIRLCASYNRLNDFLGTMSPERREGLLKAFVSGLDKVKDPLSDAVTVADAFSMITDEDILRVLQTTIRAEFERVQREGKKEAKILYGLLAGMFAKKAVINEEWIREMSERYKLPSLTTIPSSSLFNPDGANIQQYFFYGDKDGEASFANFLGQYRGKSGWKIEDRGTYVLIRSATVGGKRIEIYANKPTSEAVEKGPEDIQKVFKERRIESIVVVHRGHSYHAGKTIERIPRIARVVSLGSCGGYNNVSAVLEKAPDAHIITTKGIGTMVVNDPLFKMLNEVILRGDINWPEFWAKAEKRFGEIDEFKSYVPPHRNLGVLFLKAYFKITAPAAQ